MKKLIIGITVVAMILSVTACSDHKDTEEKNNKEAIITETKDQSEQEVSKMKNESVENHSTDGELKDTDKDKNKADNSEAKNNSDDTQKAVKVDQIENESVSSSDVDIKKLRMLCKTDNAICAVAYVGYCETGTAEAVQSYVAKSPLSEEYEFLKDVDKDQIVFAGGSEIYSIVPLDDSASMVVNEISLGDDGNEVVGDTIYEGDGKPILLVCNISDIMTNSKISLTVEDQMIEFSPYISLKDGTLAITKDEKYIYDFSELEIIE